MKKFQFRLASLMKYREHQRNLRQLDLAKILQWVNQLQEQIRQTRALRGEELASMEQACATGKLDVTWIASQRFYLTQLDIQVRGYEQQILQLQPALEKARQALVEADQQVKMLEKLKEKSFAEFQSVELRRELLELEETWLATHQQEFTS